VNIRFLSLEDVMRLHTASIRRFGGTLGVRDQGGLESAVFHPQNVYFYGQGDIYDVAAAYAFHIAEGQCFLDGNKRTAVAAALVILRKNGADLGINERDLYDLVIGIAEKRVSKSDLAAYLRRSSPPK
jgi:death-on-curing protein